MKIYPNQDDLTIVHALADAPLVFGFAAMDELYARELAVIKTEGSRCFKCKEEKKDYVTIGYHKTADFAESHKLSSQDKEIPRCRKQRNSCAQIPCLIGVGQL
jgi:hypothetical protein